MAKEKFDFTNEEMRNAYRHTTSHILAQAVKNIWPPKVHTKPDKTFSFVFLLLFSFMFFLIFYFLVYKFCNII